MRLDQYKFGVQHDTRPVVNQSTGEPELDEEGVQKQVGVHSIAFSDTGPAAGVIAVDLTDNARDTMVVLLAEDYLLTGGGTEAAENGEAELLRRVRAAREDVLQYRQRVRATEAGLELASADALPPGAPKAP